MKHETQESLDIKLKIPDSHILCSNFFLFTTRRTFLLLRQREAKAYSSSLSAMIPPSSQRWYLTSKNDVETPKIRRTILHVVAPLFSLLKSSNLRYRKYRTSGRRDPFVTPSQSLRIPKQLVQVAPSISHNRRRRQVVAEY